jgi:hypothetical protein
MVPSPRFHDELSSFKATISRKMSLAILWLRSKRRLSSGVSFFSQCWYLVFGDSPERDRIPTKFKCSLD